MVSSTPRRITSLAARTLVAFLIGHSAISAQEIQMGRPKLWLYDRLYPNLDGLLRDAEGISLNSLSGLDPNALNARVVDFLQSVFQASVNADQTAGVTNAAVQSLFKASQSLLGVQTTAAQSLSAEKLNLLQSLSQALDAQQKRIAALPQGTSCANDPQCQQLQQNVTDLNALWTSLQSASTAVGTPGSLTPPTLTGVTATPVNPPPALSSIVDPKSFLTTALSSTGGSLPPREQLDNFITLLNDRLTKQMALSPDEDGLRGDYLPLVAEFDVSIDARPSRKDQSATSVFELDAPGCPTGKHPIVYNLYPSLSAFNVADVQGKSSGFMLNGGIKGLFLGGSGSYQREHDRVSQALRQSVYMSGFRDGASKFGWVYRPPTYTNLIRPGLYATFALVLVPKDSTGSPCGLTITGQSHWTTKGGTVKDRSPEVPLGNFSGFEASYAQPQVTHVQYGPHYASSDDLQTDVNVVTVEFKRPINPNLMITASGKLLKRVRDWRGRATTPGSSDSITVTDSSGAAHQVSRARGLFEADIDEADTWIAVSQTKIMLKLKYATAGALTFPEIRLLTPGGQNWSLPDLVDYRTYAAKVTIGSHEFLACHPKINNAGPDNQGCMKQPDSMWLPLFVVLPSQGHKLRVSRTGADAPDNSNMPGQAYFFLSADEGRARLSPRSQVVLTDPGHSRFPHPIPIECSSLLNGLLCHTHPPSMLYGTECLAPPPAGSYRPVFNSSLDTCKIENYPLLRIELTQPGTKENPTLYLSAVFPQSGGPAPVIGPVATFTKQPGRLHFTFPVFNLAVGASPLALRSNGTPVAGATASVTSDPAGSGLPVLAVDLPGDGLGAIVPGPLHLYANDLDYGPLPGVQDLVLPSNLELTMQNKFYQFTGTHIENIDRFYLGDSNKELTPVPFDSGLLVNLSQDPQADSLLYFAIAGVKRPVVACFNKVKAYDAAASKTPDAPAGDGKATTPDKTKPQTHATAKEKSSVEVNTTTKVKTGDTTETSSGETDTSGGSAVPAKPAATPQTERVCGPIIVAAASAKGAAPATAATALVTQGAPPPPTLTPAPDSAKRIYQSAHQ